MTLPNSRDELRERWNLGESFEFYLFYGHKPPATGVDESCLSQWFERAFEFDGVRYPTAEHWMMAEKARLFNDNEMLEKILSCETPKEAKAFGRKVSGFDNQVWGDRKFEIVVRGNHAKFTQHDDLKQFLLETAQMDLSEYRKVAESKESYTVGNETMGQVDNDSVSERLGIYRVEGSDELKSTDTKSNSVNRTQSKPGSNVILVEAAGRDTIWGIGLGKHNPKSQDPFTWRGLNLLGFALTTVREVMVN